MPFGRRQYLLPVKCYLVIAVSRFKLNRFSTRSVHSILLSGRVFIEAPFGTKELPSLMPALAGPLKLTSQLVADHSVIPFPPTANGQRHEVFLVQRAQLLRPSMFRNSAGTADLFARPISTTAWAFNEDMQVCTTVAGTKVWPIKVVTFFEPSSNNNHCSSCPDRIGYIYSGIRRHEERVIDSSISGGATHRPGFITWSPNTRGPSDLGKQFTVTLVTLELSLIATATVAGRLEVELKCYQPADVGLELPLAHTATILDPGVRCDSAAELPDPQYTLLFTPLGDKDTKIMQSLTEILFVWLLPAKFKKELVLMGLVADGAEPRLPNGASRRTQNLMSFGSTAEGF
ncbi:uncharacterized protein F5891DRAFT_975588 [Suillus fuscotomentosus]|uniref:Uncharacterized protein n=1 Tax=Suillus fuscotomentosus TaxID=1912939 RepID=A0AAD4EH54_9AGAM|nr:uncharacterized protein F5891DRAFT_975588 [Suillus fuscotomentosus]KAG1906145.1 hypothetical protein F5891DRAFT_975588 [Suillus fuscotomentosus]